jgi:hypothetical protein
MLRVLSFIVSMVFAVLGSGEPGESARYDRGVVVSSVYNEAVGDFYTTTIETSDGNLWVLEDVIAPVGSSCIVEFDTMGTATVFDDVIVSIITVQRF